MPLLELPSGGVPFWRTISAVLIVGFFIFFADLFVLTMRAYVLFLPKYARGHRVFGFLYLSWITFGFIDIRIGYMPRIAFDVVLGVLGIMLTLTAAYGFPAHKRVRNRASGTLEHDSTVTFSEMIEHSFYQALNLVQILFLHIATTWSPPLSLVSRLVLAILATSPWLIRSYFPVNKFSDNFKHGEWDLIAILYRLKKYQYIFYKHCLLHGLNISVALGGAEGLARKQYFKWYWAGLNLAYVMEFYLQTLVKRKKLSQRHMLAMQQLLMFACTLAALPVLLYNVQMPLAGLSLFLNFVNRKKEMMNVAIVIVVGYSLAHLL